MRENLQRQLIELQADQLAQPNNKCFYQACQGQLYTKINSYSTPPYYFYAEQLKSLTSKTEPSHSRAVSSGRLLSERVGNTLYYWGENETYCYTWREEE